MAAKREAKDSESEDEFESLCDEDDVIARPVDEMVQHTTKPQRDWLRRYTEQPGNLVALGFCCVGASDAGIAKQPKKKAKNEGDATAAQEWTSCGEGVKSGSRMLYIKILKCPACNVCICAGCLLKFWNSREDKNPVFPCPGAEECPFKKQGWSLDAILATPYPLLVAAAKKRHFECNVFQDAISWSREDHAKVQASIRAREQLQVEIENRNDLEKQIAQLKAALYRVNRKVLKLKKEECHCDNPHSVAYDFRLLLLGDSVLRVFSQSSQANQSYSDWVSSFVNQQIAVLMRRAKVAAPPPPPPVLPQAAVDERGSGSDDEAPAAAASASAAEPDVGGELYRVEDLLDDSGQRLRHLEIKCGFKQCKGYILHGVCSACRSTVCRTCGTVCFAGVGSEGTLYVHGDGASPTHVCKKEDVAAYASVDQRHCPNCNTLIHRIEGCPVMFCKACHFNFHWRTLEEEKTYHGAANEALAAAKKAKSGENSIRPVCLEDFREEWLRLARIHPPECPGDFDAREFLLLWYTYEYERVKIYLSSASTPYIEGCLRYFTLKKGFPDTDIAIHPASSLGFLRNLLVTVQNILDGTARDFDYCYRETRCSVAKIVMSADSASEAFEKKRRQVQTLLVTGARVQKFNTECLRVAGTELLLKVYSLLDEVLVQPLRNAPGVSIDDPLFFSRSRMSCDVIIEALEAVSAYNKRLSAYNRQHMSDYLLSCNKGVWISVRYIYTSKTPLEQRFPVVPTSLVRPYICSIIEDVQKIEHDIRCHIVLLDGIKKSCADIHSLVVPSKMYSPTCRHLASEFLAALQVKNDLETMAEPVRPAAAASGPVVIPPYVRASPAAPRFTHTRPEGSVVGPEDFITVDDDETLDELIRSGYIID